ncbi:hypothetical protein FBQ85_27745 [Cytophagia bacterium CHB2]|nr:hypothetical protein [Cytophagia bacterium CHB2]
MPPKPAAPAITSITVNACMDSTDEIEFCGPFFCLKIFRSAADDTNVQDIFVVSRRIVCTAGPVVFEHEGVIVAARARRR